METFVRTTDELFHLTIAGVVVSTTAEHPFMVRGRGWIDAAFLKVGDLLVTPEGTTVPVEAIETEHRADADVETVYNFHVETHHNYFVYAGDKPILVHNSSHGDAVDLGANFSSEAKTIAAHSRARAAQPGGGDHYVRDVDPTALDSYVDGVLDGVVPNLDHNWTLARGRAAHWDPDKGAVVIEDGAGGTVFTPTNGKDYFDNDLE